MDIDGITIQVLKKKKTIHSIAKMLEEKGNSLLQRVIKNQRIASIVIKSKFLHKDIQDAILQLKHRRQSIEDSLVDLHTTVTIAENQKIKAQRIRQIKYGSYIERICKLEIMGLISWRSQMITCDAESQVEVLEPLIRGGEDSTLYPSYMRN